MRHQTFAAALWCLVAAACGGAEELALNPVRDGGAGAGGKLDASGGATASAGASSSGGSSVSNGATTTGGGTDAGGEEAGGENDAPCRADGDCLSEDAPRCGPTATCVECLSDADCSGEKPFCNVQEGTCDDCSGADCLQSACEPGSGECDTP